MTAKTLVNWDRTLRWTPTAVETPRSEEEVVRAVRRALAAGERLKPVGAALSWSDAGAPAARAMRFDAMADVLEVNREERTVRLQPGARLARVNQALAGHGLAFDNFGSITMQTAGGYTGTGSHGTGARTPVLSAALRSMRLVDGTGAVHELGPSVEPELFRAARVHLGCLGVVTELTFQCVDAFDLEERLELVDLSQTSTRSRTATTTSSCGGCRTAARSRSTASTAPRRGARAPASAGRSTPRGPRAWPSRA